MNTVTTSTGHNLNRNMIEHSAAAQHIVVTTRKDVVQAFKLHQFNKGRKDYFYQRNNVIYHSDHLYSCGSDFVLAYRCNPDNNLKNGRQWFLVNGDRHSLVTLNHQEITFNEFSEHPRVAFSALRAAGIDYAGCYLVDFVEDHSVFIYKDETITGNYSYDPDKEELWNNFETLAPGYAKTYILKDKSSGEIIMKSYHTIGTVVLRCSGNDYLCSMDEGSYFVSRLPCNVISVAEAFNALKPEVVRLAEKEGKDIFRQGEWFFFEAPEGVTQKITENDFISQFRLNNRRQTTHDHIVTGGLLYNGLTLVQGTVKHIHPSTGTCTGKHRELRLPQEKIFIAIENSAHGSWSANGYVD